MPALVGSSSGGFSRSGHSGGCSFLFFFSLLEYFRTSLPSLSVISSVISFGSDLR